MELVDGIKAKDKQAIELMMAQYGDYLLRIAFLSSSRKKTPTSIV